MAITLEDSWTTYARAIEHVDPLASECDDYLQTVVVSAETIHNAEMDAVEVRFRSDPAPSPRLGAIVGDIGHNLRSGLDIAAWQLAIAHNQDAARKHRIATFSFTGMSTDPIPEVGVQRFSGYHVYFGTDEGQIGIGGFVQSPSP